MFPGCLFKPFCNAFVIPRAFDQTKIMNQVWKVCRRQMSPRNANNFKTLGPASTKTNCCVGQSKENNSPRPRRRSGSVTEPESDTRKPPLQSVNRGQDRAVQEAGHVHRSRENIQHQSHLRKSQKQTPKENAKKKCHFKTCI